MMARPEHNLQQAAWVYAQHVLPPEADFASVETKAITTTAKVFLRAL